MTDSETDAWKQFEADADAFSNLTTEAGTELSGLIRQVTSVEKDLAAKEAEVKALKAKKNDYLFDLIPSKMQEIGLDKVEVDGNAVSLTTFVSGTMPKDPIQKDIALSHLREIGASDFIKNKITVSFGVTEDNRAKALQADLEAQGFTTDAETKVEPMTLKKIIKEYVGNGKEIDLEIFNASIGTVAKIKGE
jgi:phosphopantetheinyl transferase (holo-ACP synthase)